MVEGVCEEVMGAIRTQGVGGVQAASATGLDVIVELDVMGGSSAARLIEDVLRIQDEDYLIAIRQLRISEYSF